MSISRVQGFIGNIGTLQNPATAYSSNNTAGNFLVVASMVSSGATTTSGVPTDTLGNTWVLADSALAANSNIYIYYVANCLGGANTVTIHFSGVPSNNQRAMFYEYSGVATTSPLDVHTSKSSVSAVASVASIGPLTASVSGELGFVVFKNQSSNTVMSPYSGGFTDVLDTTIANSGDNLSASGATTANATTNGASDTYSAVLALFKPAPSGAAADVIGNSICKPAMIYGRAPNGVMSAVTTDGNGNIDLSGQTPSFVDTIGNSICTPVTIYGRAPNGQLQAVGTDGAGNLA